MATILLVEDEPSIQELVKFNLTQAGHSVLCADSAEMAAGMVKHRLPDLVLLDWMLPGMNGIDLARNFRADDRMKNMPIIMLTACGEERDKVLALEIGADDYITKPFSPRELSARINALLRRRAPQKMTEDKVVICGLSLDPVNHRVTGNGTSAELGPTEFRLLHFLLTHPERVYSRSQLLDQVWGDHVFVEERTVDVHISRLRLVLEPTQHETLIDTVRGAGYRLSTQVRRGHRQRADLIDL